MIVADTSPINYLVRLGHIDLLPDLYGDIVLPEAVAAELMAKGTPDVVRSWVQSLPSWLHVRSCGDVRPDLATVLHRGEAEAISLALELKTSLLIDEAAGRRIAMQLGIEIAGTLGVLVRGSLRGRVDMPSALVSLQEQGFRVSAELKEQILRLATDRR